MNICILDDNEVASEILIDYLIEKGHIVSWAKSKSAAKLLLSTSKPEVIMMDPTISNGDLNLLLWIPDKSILILMSTNRKLNKMVYADYHLLKPFSLNDLDVILATIKRNQTSVS